MDCDKIVATGISWGAYITNIVAGVDTRIAALAPVYGSGFIYEDAFWTDKGPFAYSRRDEWIKLYDPSSYVFLTKKPMMFVSGIDDVAFSVKSRMKTVDLVESRVYLSQRTDLEHGHYWDKTPEINAFFRNVLYGEPTLTEFGDISVDNGIATMHSTNDLFETVNFVYTLSKDENSHDWKWESVEVQKNNGCYSYSIPDDVTAYYFEVVADSQKGNGDKLFRQSTRLIFA